MPYVTAAYMSPLLCAIHTRRHGAARHTPLEGTLVRCRHVTWRGYASAASYARVGLVAITATRR